MSSSEAPRYKVISKTVAYIDGRLLAPGAIFESIGWPHDTDVEPMNAEAERVMAFKKQHFAEPVCGHRTSPFSAKLGTIFLPHTDANPVDPATVSDDAPRYAAPHGAEFQSRNVGPDEAFCFLAWPAPDWTPKNRAAKEILAWLSKHGSDPRMPLAPWNDYDDSLVLQDMPEIKNPGMNATDIVPYQVSPYQREIERHVNRPRRAGRRTAA